MDDVTFRMAMGAARPEAGQQAWTTPGTYPFTVPNTTTLDAVLIGPGGGGGGGPATSGRYGDGAYGGATRWITGLPVTPGEVLTVVIMAGAAGRLNNTGTSATAGAACELRRGSQVLLRAGTGNNATPIGPGPFGGTVGGGDGAAGSVGTTSNYAGAGGGAGGYSGNGGTETGGCGGNGGRRSSTGGAGPSGGGVGLLGEGASGLNGLSGPGRGGSLGQDGSNAGSSNGATGGNFGGGGGGGGPPLSGAPGTGFGGTGGDGAGRAIWGPGRFYPSTNTQDI